MKGIEFFWKRFGKLMLEYIHFLAPTKIGKLRRKKESVIAIKDLFKSGLDCTPRIFDQ